MNDVKRHEYYMNLAVIKAKEGIMQGQTPFGACIVNNNKVLSCEHNEVWQSLDITAHAEVCAIRRACKKYQTVDLSGSVIYSTCEPCPMCYSACHWAGIRTIVYGANIKDAEKAGFNEMPIGNKAMKKLSNNRIIIVEKVLKDKCKDLFRLWMSQDNQKAY